LRARELSAKKRCARRNVGVDREGDIDVTDEPDKRDRLSITDTLTRLFVYTDQARWDDLVEHVFAETVDFDGGFGDPAGPRSGRAVADGWQTGLAGLDAVHHQSGNYLVDIDGDHASAHADAIAVHVNNSATNGKTRMFVGSYAIGLQRVDAGWRIDRFVYKLKVVDGNVDLT
jgi:hypothetical protein